MFLVKMLRYQLLIGLLVVSYAQINALHADDCIKFTAEIVQNSDNQRVINLDTLELSASITADVQNTIDSILKRVGSFANMSLKVLDKSPEICVMARQASYDAILDYINNLPKQLCQTLNVEVLEDEMTPLDKLLHEAKMEIMYYSMWMKSKFTMIGVPDINVHDVIKFDNRFDNLKDMWRTIDTFTINNFLQRFELISATVKGIILTTVYLSRGEKVLRLEQLANINEHRSKIIGTWRKKNPTVFSELTWPKEAKKIAAHTKDAYTDDFNRLKADYAQNFDVYENHVTEEIEKLILIIDEQEFFMAEEFAQHLIKNGNSLQPTLDFALKEIDKFMAEELTPILHQSVALFEERVAKFQDAGVRAKLTESIVKYGGDAEKAIIDTIHFQIDRVKAAIPYYIPNLEKVTDVNQTLEKLRGLCVLIWKDLYSLPRRIFRAFDERCDTAIKFANYFGIAAPQYIPPPMSLPTITFIIPQLWPSELQKYGKTIDEVLVIAAKEYKKDLMKQVGQIQTVFQRLDTFIISYCNGSQAQRDALLAETATNAERVLTPYVDSKTREVTQAKSILKVRQNTSLLSLQVIEDITPIVGSMMEAELKAFRESLAALDRPSDRFYTDVQYVLDNYARRIIAFCQKTIERKGRSMRGAIRISIREMRKRDAMPSIADI